ncbi:phage tail tape measure protein [Clostridium sp.]|uniref:phage tail tape measure protein n=1 Tax=Clostridium sp. TaxID=1506 RepID=UPI00290D297B|nr:phage tail tape measure protein [Clostridium sp.]MDU4478633.1 phage tail tape measure protein [Clostridium sp.]
MANKEVYRLSINVNVTGDKKSKQKISDLEGVTEKVEKKLKKLSDITASPSAKIKDNASSTIEKVESKVKKLSRATGTAKLQAKDSASVVVQKVITRTEQLNNKKIKPKIDIDDNASKKTKDIKEKVDELDKKKAKVKIEAEDQVTKTIEKVDSKLKGWLKSGAKKIISIGLAGTMLVGGLSIKSTMETFTSFEQGLSNVKAITEATDAEMLQLKQAALDLGASTAWSASQVTEAEELLGQAGYSTQENIAALPGLLSLASAGSLDLASATDIAVSSMKAFNIDASKAGHVADVLSLSANATNSDVTDLGEAMKYIAPVANSLGISIEDTASAVGLLSNAGIKGSQAGTVLRQTLNRLASPTDKASELIEEYGIKAFDAQGNMKSLGEVVDILNNSLKNLNSQQKADVISTIFGTESMSGVLALMNQGGSAVAELTKRLEEADGAAQKVADTKLDNLAGQMENLGGAVETMKINLGDRLAPYAKEFVTWVTDKIPVLEDKVVSIVDYISKHTEDIKSMAIATTGVVGAIAGLSVAGSVGNSISGISKFISLVKGASVVKETTEIASGFNLIGIAAEGLPALISPAGLAIAAGVATTAYAIHSYNKLMKESITTVTEDLSIGEKIINKLTGSVLKSKKELQEAGIVYDDFGEGISDDFKKAAQDASKSLLEIEMNINRLNIDNIMDESDKHAFRQYINEFAYEGINAMKEQKSKIESEFNKTFNLDGTLSDTEKTTLDYVQQYYQDGINKELEIRNEIYEIGSKAIEEHGKILDGDMKKIKSKLSELSALKLQYLNAESEKELKYSTEKFTRDSSKVAGLDEASNLVQDRRKTYENSIEEIYKNYSDTLYDLNTLLESASDKTQKENLQKQIEETTKQRDEALNKANEAWKSDMETLYQAYPNAKGKLNEYTGKQFSDGDIQAQKRMDSMLSEYLGLNSVTESGVYSVTDSLGNLNSFYVQIDETTKKITGLYETATQRAGGYTKEISNNMQNVMSEQEKTISQVMNSISNSHPHLDLATNTIKDYSGFTISELEKVTTEADGTTTAITTINDTPIQIRADVNEAIIGISEVGKMLNQLPSFKQVMISTATTIGGTTGSRVIEIAKSAMQQNATGTNNASEGLSQVAENGMELVIGRSVRWLNAGDKVLNNSDTKKFFGGLGKTQVFQPKPQVQVVGSEGNNFGDINLNINNGQNPEQLIEQACQAFARKLREAILNTKN